ncbi:hypothetical protein Golomagni_00311 [Golovinomyces magnicellulatus]|nr:hypothetical protein Golomagni_00311 [Golovinomyces magnicellulatus]
MVDKPPTQDKLLQTKTRPWELPNHRPNPTASRAAFKTYSTTYPISIKKSVNLSRVMPKITPWEASAGSRK